MKKELLGIDKINAVLNKFLEPFEAHADLGEEFSYWYADSRIEYNLVVIEASTDYFMQNFNKMAPDLNCDPFLASFLHELGHHETLDFIDEDYRPIKMQLEEDLKRVSKSAEAIIHQKYFDLPVEYEATMWAIEYMRNNAQKVAEFWKELQEAIMEFYRLNEVEVA
jgi:hypothetical protein